MHLEGRAFVQKKKKHWREAIFTLQYLKLGNTVTYNIDFPAYALDHLNSYILHPSFKCDWLRVGLKSKFPHALHQHYPI